MGKKLTVKQWRMLKEQSQKEFSKNVGMNYHTYKTRELGMTEWSASELKRISMYLGISIEHELEY